MLNIDINPRFERTGDFCRLWHKYLLEHSHALYTTLCLSGKLTTHQEEIDRVAIKMYDRLVGQLKERDGVTEELKVLH